MKNSALTFDEVKSLLPDSFKNIQKERPNIYSSSKGLILYTYSKYYNYSSKDWWYAISPEYISDNNISYLCLGVDFSGIFLIPSHDFLSYHKSNNVGRVRGGRANFSVIKQGERFIRKESKCNNWDITAYFIPNHKLYR